MMTDNLCRKRKLADSFIPCGNDIRMTCQSFFFLQRNRYVWCLCEGKFVSQKRLTGMYKTSDINKYNVLKEKKNIPPPNQSSVKNVEF